MKNKHESEEPNDLRQRAQKCLSDSGCGESECVSDADTRRLLHELQAHQIELELQNEELEERVEQRTQELRDANARLASVLESITDCRFSLDHDWRFLEINPAAERAIFHRPAEELTGAMIWKEYPQAVGSEFYRRVILAITEQTPVHFEARSWTNEARWLECHVFPRADRLEVYLRDITDRKEAEVRQQEFYRRTILAATQGKLVIMDRDEVHAIAGTAIKQWDINSSESMSIILRDSLALAESKGMDPPGLHRLTTCIVESVGNVLKHAGSGTASIHHAEDGLLLLVEDNGPGIGAMSIPNVALLRRYSTSGTFGMGYKLMMASSRKIYLATGTDGTTVAFDIPVQSNDSAGTMPVGAV